MPTLTEILADINLRYPNTFTDGQLVYWVNRILGKYYKYAPLEVKTEVTLTTSPSYLTDSTDGFRFENLVRVEYYNTTDAIATTDRDEYILYDKAGTMESRANDHIYDSSGGLGFYPPPTTVNQFIDKRLSVKYYKFPEVASTTALSATPDINEDYHDIIVFGTINIASKSGINPDIDIANNAQADFNEVLKQARMERSRKRYYSDNKNRISYKEGWSPGNEFFSSSS